MIAEPSPVESQGSLQPSPKMYFVFFVSRETITQTEINEDNCSLVFQVTGDGNQSER